MENAGCWVAPARRKRRRSLDTLGNFKGRYKSSILSWNYKSNFLHIFKFYK